MARFQDRVPVVGGEDEGVVMRVGGIMISNGEAWVGLTFGLAFGLTFRLTFGLTYRLGILWCEMQDEGMFGPLDMKHWNPLPALAPASSLLLKSGSQN